MRTEIVVAREIVAGQPVPIALRIVNTSARPLELHLQGRSVAFDLTVQRGDSVVWRRLENATLPAILQIRILAPGEVLELQDTWDGRDRAGLPVGQGDYTVRGSVPTDGMPIRAGPVPLRISG
jgi:hypothetical protein